MSDTELHDFHRCSRERIDLENRLAAAITSRLKTSGIAPAARPEIIPLSLAQQRLWFMEQLEGGMGLYNIANAWWLQGPLDAKRLQDAMNSVIARHEALRTAFVSTGGEARQEIRSELSIDLPLIDLSDLPPATARQRARAEAAALGALGFNLAEPPLLRAALYRTEPSVHLLVLVIHHIVSDGWSMGVLGSELSLFYSGRGSELPPLPVQYADYTLWQRQRLQGGNADKQLAWWKRQLDGVAPLELPLDRQRPVAQDYRGERLALTLAPDLLARLKQLCRQEQVTLYMLLLAAFKVVLARWSGQSDIAVGSPVAGRERYELEGLIGFFVNTLVIRTDTGGNPTFRELLLRVKKTVLDAHEHQLLPFEQLVSELNPPRDPGRNPFFDVLFNMFEAVENPLHLDHIDCSETAPDTRNSKFSLTLYAVEEKGTMAFDLVYQTACFSRERIMEFMGQFHCLLAQAIADPDKGVLAYSLITASASALLPDPSSPLFAPPQQSVIDLFFSFAERNPEAAAISSGNAVWNYRCLCESAYRVSDALSNCGMKLGETIAIVGSSCFGLVSCLFGVLMTGGVFVMVDESLPPFRQETMLREAGTKAVLRIGKAAIPAEWVKRNPSVPVIDIDPLEGVYPAERDASLYPCRRREPAIGKGAAYIFYTSGSTGLPKAVLGTHEGLAHFLDWQRKTFAVTENDRVAQLTSLSFDAVLRDFFLPLTSGATLCIPEEGDRTDPLQWIDHEKITILHCVPSLLNSWLADTSSPGSMSALRLLFLAGETLNYSLVRKWRSRFAGNTEIVNFYGPTETTLVKCCYRVPDSIQPGILPVGTALPDTQALVLNEAGQPCGIGETGEVVLRTPFRTLGYINAVREMKKRFIPNPFPGKNCNNDDLLYFTGDRGRYRTDGLLELDGRLDEQIKIRGVRIEPGEVKAAIEEHPSVMDSFVLGRKNNEGEPYLAAYIVEKEYEKADHITLRSFLSTRLPSVMVPATWTFLDALPLLPNGKIDRLALPEPDIRTDNKHLPPSTPLEIIVAELWLDLLKVHNVNTDDDFFDSGGHSLLALKFINRLNRKTGVHLTLHDLFETPTIGGLALKILGKLVEENVFDNNAD
jgi:amino acid adenylation domain-containing protein